MTTKMLTWMLATAATLGVVGCGRKDDRRAGSTLSRDTAVAAELQQAADTAAYREAADVAMRDIPDSTLPMPPKRTMVTHGVRQPAESPASPTRPSAPPAVRRSAPPPAPVRAAPAAQVTMRPAPPSDVRPSIPPSTPVARPAPAPMRAAAAVPNTAGSDASYPTPACASPALPDQRRCLMSYLARSDDGLDRTYQALIRRMKSDAGTAPGAPEPESVQRLRTAQRAWLVYRDTECRNRNRGREGPLWAPTRARCLGEFSQARADELSR